MSDEIDPTVADEIHMRCAAIGMTPRQFADVLNTLTPDQIAAALERSPTTALEFGVRFEALSHAARETQPLSAASVEPLDAATLRPGDVVTSRLWEAGHTETIEKIAPGPENVAMFEGGGFWRVSQLVKACPACKGTGTNGRHDLSDSGSGRMEACETCGGSGKLLHPAQQLKAEGQACECPARKALEDTPCKCTRKMACPDCGSALVAGEDQFDGGWICSPCNNCWSYCELAKDKPCARCAALSAPCPCEGLRGTLAGYPLTIPFETVLKMLAAERDSLRDELAAIREKLRQASEAASHGIPFPATDDPVEDAIFMLRTLPEELTASQERARNLREALEEVDATLCECRYGPDRPLVGPCNCDIHAAHRIIAAALATPEGTPE